MRAIPTGISEAHEVDVHLTCDAGLFLVSEQLVDAFALRLREAKAALIAGDAAYASGQVTKAVDLINSIEHDGGVCSFAGTVEGYYIDDDTAEAECPECGTVHEVRL